MLGIILFCVGVMYTPGPVNILSLKNGMQQRFNAHIPFSLGVAAALSIWFLLIGYTGSAVINENAMPFIATAGVGFILYLACKIISSNIDISHNSSSASNLTFRDGLLMQLLNPKTFVVVLPVTAVQFPAAGIGGSEIAVWSMGLGALGFGAPFVYAFAGSRVSKYFENPIYIKWLNYIMGAILIIVALEMAYDHIYLTFS